MSCKEKESEALTWLKGLEMEAWRRMRLHATRLTGRRRQEERCEGGDQHQLKKVTTTYSATLKGMYSENTKLTTF